jgi:hypothetical protein
MPETLVLDCDFAARFVYWRGASRRRYIHTVYDADACPPLPGAVYMSVARAADGRCRALAVGRFPKQHAFSLARTAVDGDLAGLANEIHVHLLAENEAERQAIVDDLRCGLKLDLLPQRAPGSCGLAQPCRFAA